MLCLGGYFNLEEEDYEHKLLVHKNHELNTKFNGLFKDCIYGSDNDFAVKGRQAKLENHIVTDSVSHAKICEFIDIIGEKLFDRYTKTLNSEQAEIFINCFLTL